MSAQCRHRRAPRPAFCQCKAGFAGPENPVNDTNCRKCAPGTCSASEHTQLLAVFGRLNGVGLLLLIEEAAACQACPSGQPLLGIAEREQLHRVPPWNVPARGRRGPGELCIPCPAGTYQELSGQTEQRHCQFCDAGKYSNITGATSHDNCTACPAGTFLARAASFENLHQTVETATVPAGKFGPRVGAIPAVTAKTAPLARF